MVRCIQMDSSLNKFLEPLHFGYDGVISDHQARKNVVTRTVCCGFLGSQVALIPNDHSHARNNGIGSIYDSTGNSSDVHLGNHGNHSERQNKHTHPPSIWVHYISHFNSPSGHLHLWTANTPFVPHVQ